MIFRTSWCVAFCVLTAALSSPAATAQDKPFLHALFTDHMVLQRGIESPVWGWSEPGDEVTVSIAGKTAKATAGKDGRWLAKVSPLEAGGPFTLNVSGPQTATVNDVLVGDVWICSGQSNMEFPVAASINSQQEIAAADHPTIRLFTVPKRISLTPQENVASQWQVCSPKTVPRFSAVGYYFGRDLSKNLNVPIGLIHTSWGGTVAEAWTSAEALQSMPDFQPALAAVQDLVAAQASGSNDADGKTAEKLNNDPNVVTVLFNGMLAPLVPYGVKGATWYQGESNAGRAAQYRTLLPTMIADWRSRFGLGDFPFLIVELANFMDQQTEPVQSGWAELREAQWLTARNDENAGLASAIDIGDAKDIHPKNKQEVGRRLALAALEIAYGKNLISGGPDFASAEFKDGKAYLKFRRVGEGLMAKGDELKGFAIAGDDGKFVWAEAVIDGDTVILSAPEVSDPKAARYNWANNPIGNFYNHAGLPASPFRTDVE